MVGIRQSPKVVLQISSATTPSYVTPMTAVASARLDPTRRPVRNGRSALAHADATARGIAMHAEHTLPAPMSTGTGPTSRFATGRPAHVDVAMRPVSACPARRTLHVGKTGASAPPVGMNSGRRVFSSATPRLARANSRARAATASATRVTLVKKTPRNALRIARAWGARVWLTRTAARDSSAAPRAAARTFLRRHHLLCASCHTSTANARLFRRAAHFECLLARCASPWEP